MTSLLFAVGKLLIGLYLGHASVGSTFGRPGSLLVFLVWVYYSAQILFFGAEFTQVYARRYGSRHPPSEGAVPLTEEARAEQGMPRQEDVKTSAARPGNTPAVATVAAQSDHAQDRPYSHAASANGTKGRTNGAHASTNGTATKDHANGQNGHRAPNTPRKRGSGGTKGAPDAVKKLMWSGLVSGSMAVGALAARRASAGIWRTVLHEEPPTKDV